MIRRFLARLWRRNPVEPAFPCISSDVLIARRAMRLHNRDSEKAARFERVHTILSRGRK
jgi:hypothetical protein